MRRIVGYARVLATLFLSGLAQSAAPNTITFDNQSGTDAMVKMVGRTRGAVPVPNRSRASVQVEPGSYYILVRYGSAGHYSYSKGEKFSVESHADTYTARARRSPHRRSCSSPRRPTARPAARRCHRDRRRADGRRDRRRPRFGHEPGCHLMVTETLFDGVAEQALCTIAVHVPEASSPPSEALT